MSSRLLALLGSTLVATLLGYVSLRVVRAGSGDLEFVDSDIEGVARDRGLAEQASGEPSFPYSMSEAEAERIWHLAELDRIYDPFTGFRMEPNRVFRKDWPEYPGGEYVSRTNSEGLADDELDRAQHFDLRVVATGDSHTFGLCERERTWPAELQRLLADRNPGRSVEVLNTGQGCYTFYHYAGMLEAYLDWVPQVFLLAAFAGNDFAEQLVMAPLFGESPRYHQPEDEERRRSEALKAPKLRPPLGQCYSTLLRFGLHQEWIEPAIECSANALAYIKRDAATSAESSS